MIFEEFTNSFIKLAKEIYGSESIPLHRPLFNEKEKELLNSCIDSNFVSSAGPEITIFEQMIADLTQSKHVVATVSGTAALHSVLSALGINEENEIITQCLSFVATANAIKYCNSDPIFIDVEGDTGTMSPQLLREFLQNQTYQLNGKCINKNSGKTIAACVVMHTFGHPANVTEISSICSTFGLRLIEDSAEALGSIHAGYHVGHKAFASIYSFNGNKIITTGGGGCVTTNDFDLAQRIRHLTTTAKCNHQYEYFHDEVGFNYRLPNLNACLGIAQLEKLSFFLEQKRNLFLLYEDFASSFSVRLWKDAPNNLSNYWLNALTFDHKEDKAYFLNETNNNSVMTRPLWYPLHKLPAFKDCLKILDGTTEQLYETTVNLPSSVPSLR